MSASPSVAKRPRIFQSVVQSYVIYSTKQRSIRLHGIFSVQQINGETQKHFRKVATRLRR